MPPGSLSGYPLTLNSLRLHAQDSWARLSADKWLQALVCEVLVTHQRIAIRRMGQSGEDTLMFRSGDLGFFVHREMERIVETQPRLRQALQILRSRTDDLGRQPAAKAYVPRRVSSAGACGVSDQGETVRLPLLKSLKDMAKSGAKLDASIVTTYAFNGLFYEEVLLRAFERAGSRLTLFSSMRRSLPKE